LFGGGGGVDGEVGPEVETTCLGFARHGSSNYNYNLTMESEMEKEKELELRRHQTFEARRGVYYNDRAGKFFGTHTAPGSPGEKPRKQKTDKREDTEPRS